MQAIDRRLPDPQVESARLITDFNTGRSRGFGFVEMHSEDEARVALEKMHRAKVGERELVVSEARPRDARPQRSGAQRA